MANLQAEERFRKPGWSAGGWFVGPAGITWALPTITPELVAEVPELAELVAAVDDHNPVGRSRLIVMLAHTAAALIAQQYDLNPASCRAIQSGRLWHDLDDWRGFPWSPQAMALRAALSAAGMAGRLNRPMREWVVADHFALAQ